MKNVLYLSGAPRVSTRKESEASGPRAHVIGIINGFKSNDILVDEFIVGNQVPKEWSAKGSSEKLKNSYFKRILSDIARLVFRFLYSFKARQQFSGNYDLIYERFAAFQALGRTFQKNNSIWVLETNAPLFYEAKHERKSIVLSSLAFYLEKKAYKNCDLLVCVSNRLKEIITADLGINEEKILVLPNAADTNFFKPYSKQKNNHEFDLNIGFVGTLQPWQRLDILIQEIFELKKDGYNVKFTIVGDGMARQSWQDLSIELELEKNIEFIGRVAWTDVPGLISKFDIAYSAPQNMKVGMYLSPLKLYEYMSMACPVLASQSEDAKMLIENKKTGFLFSLDKEKDLNRTIQEIVKNKDGLEQMGMNCRELIVNEHSWEKRVDTILNGIKSKIKSHD